MVIFDQHLHSDFSPDSREKLESYLAFASGEDIVTTEHLDFVDPDKGGFSSLPDYDGYSRVIDELNKNRKLHFYKGIEIGFVQKHEDRILEFLKGKDYNLKLLSIHQDGEIEFYCAEHYGFSLEKVIPYYYELMIGALESRIDFDVLAHFEYGVRYRPASYQDLDRYGRKYLEKIAELLIKKDMALEINTKSVFKYDKIDLYDYFIEIYKNKGGKLFTISSDGHSVSEFRYSFDSARDYLLNKGISEIRYHKDKKFMVSL